MRLTKLLVPALAGLTATTTGQILSAKVTGPLPVYPIGAVDEPFAKVSGRLFDINGTVQHFAGQENHMLKILALLLTCPGTNAWWLSHLTNNSDVDLALSQIKEVGSAQPMPRPV
jgi:mannan endo-1,4-beta-mannosidase